MSLVAAARASAHEAVYGSVVVAEAPPFQPLSFTNNTLEISRNWTGLFIFSRIPFGNFSFVTFVTFFVVRFGNF